MPNTLPDLFDEQVLRDCAARGDALYETKLKAELEPGRNGRAVAFILDTGDYAVARNDADALRALRQHHPEGLAMTRIIGPEQADPLAYRMLGAVPTSVGVK